MVKPRIIPDSTEMTVRIPVTVVNGDLCLLPSGRLPDLAEGTIGDLVVPASGFRKREELSQFTTYKTVQILSAGTQMAARIWPKSVPEALRDTLIRGIYVPFTLKENLSILLRGTKFAELSPCICVIPSLNVTVDSINQAYTKISENYERHRVSHTANVFSKVYYQRGECWVPLKELRGY